MKKLTDEEKLDQSKELTDEVLFNKSEEISALANDECGVCKRMGFPIFLVRKTVIKKNFNGQNWSNGVKSLGDREPTVDLKTHEWAYRTLRKGFVYILIKRTTPINSYTGYEYLFYEVTPGGACRHTTVKQPIEKNIKEIPEKCIIDGHQYKSLFITIDTSVYTGTAYIAYSRRAWSRKTIKMYQKAANSNDTTLLQRFSKINLTNSPDYSPESLSIDRVSRSFPFSDFKNGTRLIEFSKISNYFLENKSSGQMCLIKNQTQIENISLPSFIKAFNPQQTKLYNELSNNPINDNYYSTAHQFNPLNPDKVEEEIRRKTSIDKMSVLVVEDPIAVAEELAYIKKNTLYPLSQAFIQSEETYQNQAGEAYKNLLGSEGDNIIDYNDEFTRIFDKYEDLKSKNKLKYAHWAKNINGTKFDYFSEESMHLRKIIQYIDSYEAQVMNHIQNTAEEKIIYQYRYYPTGFNIIGKNDVYKDQHGNTLGVGDALADIRKYNAVSRPLTDEENISILKKEQDSLDKADESYRVEVTAFYIKNKETTLRERVEKEWKEKYESKLNLDKKKIYLSKMQSDYEKVVEYIKDHSEDYYVYLTWLFGGKERAKKIKEKLPNLEQHNELEFWLYEWDTNGSNNHISYLCDIINIIDDCQIGNIKLPYQFAIWDLLLLDSQTLYFHMIRGVNGDTIADPDENQELSETVSTKSLWDLLLQVRGEINSLNEEELNELKQQYSSELSKIDSTSSENSQEDKDRIKGRVVALGKLIADHGNELNNLFFIEKGLVLLELLDILAIRMLSAFNQRDPSILIINQNLLNKHLQEVSLVLDGKPMARFQIRKVASKDVPFLLNLFYGLPDYQIEKSPEDEDDNKEVTILITSTAKSSLELYAKIEPIIKFDTPITGAKDFAGKIYRNLIDQSTKSDGVFSGDFRLDKLDLTKVESFPNKKSIGLESTSIIVSGISLYFTIQDAYSTAATLKSFGLGQNKIDELKTKLTLSVGNAGASFISVLAATFEFGIKILKTVSNSNFLRLASLNIAKNAFMMIKIVGGIAGIIGGAIGVIEGIIEFRKALSNLDKGKQYAGLYVVGAGIQIASGVLSILGSICIFAGFTPFGAILLLIAMVAAIITTVVLFFFRDESDDWNQMQIWLNRCEFGLNKHQDKGKPYPLTYDGLAFMTNDYITARMGLVATLELENDSPNKANIPYVHELSNSSINPEYVRRAKQNCREVYLVMKLLKENSQQYKNHFEGSLKIKYTGGAFGGIRFDKTQNHINVTSKKSLSTFMLREYPSLNRSSNLSDKTKIKRDEYLGIKYNNNTNEIEPYYAVNFKVADVTSAGSSGDQYYKPAYYLRCFYWVNGKFDNNGKENIPILLHYNYTS